jgi:hypothetical protein
MPTAKVSATGSTRCIAAPCGFDSMMGDGYVR